VPVFFTKKEYFQALKQGKKTVDVRKGKPAQGSIAVFLSGPQVLRMKIACKENGKLADLVRVDNFRLIVPWANSLGEVIDLFGLLYRFGVEDIFTAYYVEPFGVENRSVII
jgi:hypothetical protein